LRGISPLATLDRGYAIVRDAQSNTVLRDANQTDKGRVVRADLAKGHIICTVNEANP
jgi:exodeoxyribonuclease VII large subunit